MNNPNTKASYWIETPGSLEFAAETLAGEQSSGTFVKLPGETDELRNRHGAKILKVTETGKTSRPSLPNDQTGWRDHDVFHQGIVEIEFPFENTGPSVVALMTQLAGNLFELSCFSGIKLLDFTPADGFGQTVRGPKFGIDGTRSVCGVNGSPIIGTILKPSVGMSIPQTANLVADLCKGGLDFIKDDELISNPPYSPVKDRAKAVMEVIDRHLQETGRQVIYACNITDSLDAMLRHHDTVCEAGGNCIMINLNAVGLAAAEKIAAHSRLPIHAHRSGWGAFSRSPALGFSYVAWQKFWRMVGMDHMHVNGLRNKFCESDESVLASARACSEPLLNCQPCMPVFSSGQWADQAFDTFKELQNVDLMYLCGGGIIGHPGGIEAGVMSVRQAWTAALQGMDAAQARAKYPELEQSYQFYDEKRK